MASPELYRQRAKVAAFSRSRADDDPELLDARRDLKAEALRLHVERALADVPPLSDEQRRSIARILIGGEAA